MHISGAIGYSVIPSQRPAAMHSKIALRVLIVEPNDDFRYVFALLLELMGYMVETVGNAAEAINRVKKSAPDVVLTELNLGDVEGLDLASQLRLLPSAKDITLFATASYIHPNIEAIALKGGFEYFLAKPITGEQIANVLQLIGNRKGGKKIWLH